MSNNSKETPRQKMIGMMYLVLTCLLALNISREVLEGFVTINESIENTNSNFTANTKMMMAAFDEAIKNGHQEAKPYYNKAREVTGLTQKTFDYVDKLKREVKQYTEDLKGADTMKLGKIENLDNFDKPTFLLIGADEKHPKTGAFSAKELRANIEMLTKELNKMITEMKDKDGLKLPEKDFLILKDKIKLFTPHDNFKDKDGKPITWEFKNFYNMPLAAVITNLSKIQSDIRNIEAEMISTFAAASSKLAVPFNVLEARIVPVSQYVQSGSPFRADVFLTASSTHFNDDNLQFILGDIDTTTGKLGAGAIVLPIEKGNGKINLPTSVAGHKEIKGWIKFREGTGIYKYFKYDNEYIVANSAVAVSADKMNVMYVGVDNPISVSAAGVAPTDLMVSIKGAGASIVNIGNGKYNVKVGSAGTCSVTVMQKTATGLKQQGTPQVFRVKSLPNPPLRVAGKTTTGLLEIDKSMATMIGSIGVDNTGFDFNAPFKVLDYTMITFNAPSGVSPEYKSSGSSLSPEGMSAIRKVKKGSKIYFENIRVQAPGGEIRDFPVIKVSVK
jgi:gliding motility-associated protein GldM